ncbi:hypothetical protein LL06_00730 [Hoeflea sp. BAL378]|uniref:hypothetical protein n=1 Tax=Hoeflea sp. BAL378 TaxID=1547437 RepID=UPI000514109D|nr:hypothetical protein [Hoeflea sp. BAL378]KGF71155.1 hypothetical protein LL06_00730 [Hoeflea sp. BAL378]
MAGEKTVRLSQGYEAHGRSFSSLTFREPKMVDFEEIGEIAEYQPAPNGGTMLLHHDDRIWKYRDRLLKRGDGLPDAGDLGELTLADAIAVKEAISDFFTQARAKLPGKPRTS